MTDNELVSKFEFNDLEHKSLSKGTSDVRFENRLFTALLAILITVNIFLFTNVIKYQKLAYKATIIRHDYDFELTQHLKIINNKLKDVDVLSTLIKSYNTKDSLFYYNEFKSVKDDVNNNKTKIVLLSNRITNLERIIK